MLSPDQRQEFDRFGLLRLPQAVPAADAEWMRERIWEFLTDEQAMSRHDPATWSEAPPKGFQELTRGGAFAAMAADSVLDACRELGADPHSVSHWGRPLLTFPRPGSWTVPTAAWHIDGGIGPNPGLTVFCHLHRVEPGGGGTVVLAGSHRLVARLMCAAAQTGKAGQPLASRVLKAKLGADQPWLRALWSADVRRTTGYRDAATIVDGVPIKVTELTGEPGDVVIMNTQTFHAPAPNVRTEPRMMLVQTLL